MANRVQRIWLYLTLLTLTAVNAQAQDTLPITSSTEVSTSAFADSTANDSTATAATDSIVTPPAPIYEPTYFSAYVLHIKGEGDLYLCPTVLGHSCDFEGGENELKGEALKMAISREIATANDFLEVLRTQSRSLDRYMRSHSKKDEGYAEAKRFADANSAQIKRVAVTISRLKKAVAYFDSEAPHYRMRAQLTTAMLHDTKRQEEGHPNLANEQLLLLRTSDSTTSCDYALTLHQILDPFAAFTTMKVDYEGNIFSFFRKMKDDATLVPYGHKYGYDGSYYHGYFDLAMQREGKGFCIDAAITNYGDWEADNYTGQILNHHQGRIYGIDISRYNHDMKNVIRTQVHALTAEGNDTIKTVYTRTVDIDWSDLRITALGPNSPKVDGEVSYPVEFVFIKCSEGKDILSKYYNADLDSCLSHGIRVAPYHFFSSKSNAKDQAAHYIAHARINEGTMRPMLDVEPESKQLKEMGGIEGCIAGMTTFVDEVEKATGRKCVLYLNQNFVKRYYHLFTETLRQCDIWIAKYHEKHPYTPHCIWQFSCKGRVNGIYGDVDLDVFNGSREDFERWCDEE